MTSWPVEAFVTRTPFGARRYCSFVQVMTLKPQYAQLPVSYTLGFRCAVVVCHILHVVSLSWHCAGSVRDPRGAGHNSPLPLSDGFTHLLTFVDRFSCWPEAVPLISRIGLRSPRHGTWRIFPSSHFTT